ncbi:MAG: hypothetical protein WCC48_06395 [Anaeromyxobacteraceae bacterium]
MNPRIALMLALLAWPHSPVGQGRFDPPVNVALGRPYTLDPRPNYSLTTESGDAVQLTDGAFASGGFWTDKAAVGWVGVKPVSITIDLGSEFEISGASFSTAAGRADVEWPSAVLVLGSIDTHTFALLGDLVALDASGGHAPRATSFARHVFASHELAGRARYVRLMAGGPGPYVFADEVEIFGHPTVASEVPRSATTDTEALFWRVNTATLLRAEVERRLLDAKTRLASSRVTPVERATLLADLDALQQRTTQLSPEDWAGVSTQYPMNDAHAAALAIIGRLEQLAGDPALRVWPANPWDSLDLTSRPPSDSQSSVELTLMDGEVRSTAVNLRNSTAKPLVATISLADVEELESGWAEVRPVAWSADAEGKPIALALLPPTPSSGVAVVTVPAGVTQQLWLTFSPAKLPAGLNQRVLRVSTPATSDLSVAVKVRILPGRFPAKPRLHLGGWDYLNDGYAAVPAASRNEVASLLEAFGVDLPWATAAVMPFGRYDAEGKPIGAPNTAVFDSWVALWPRASRFRVFVDARDDLAGLRRGTPAFDSGVRSWATFWSAHVSTLGIRPGDVDLLFVDEPRGPSEQSERQFAWARALKATGTGFKVWLDPVYAAPDQTPAAIVDTADTLCLERGLLERSGTPYRRFAGRLLSAGKTVELYGTAGPSSRLDPYAYYRLAAWRAFDVGATALGFWAFTDTGGASSWRQYQAPRTVYSPLFLDGRSVLPGKHLYAIREGIEDYEYLAMLRDVIALQATRPSSVDSTQTRARSLLSSAVARVLTSSRVDAYFRTSQEDRTLADAARLEIAQELLRHDLPPPPTSTRPQ